VGLVGFLGFCEREKKEYIGEIGKKSSSSPAY